MTAILNELSTRGWIEGKNISIDIAWGEGTLRTIQSGLDALRKRRPEIIAVSTATALREVQRSAGSAPVVFWGVSDPMKNRFVQDLAHPGGNITGFSLFDYDIGGKWLQLLKDVAPNIQRVCILMNASNPNWAGWVAAFERHAGAFKLELIRPNITEIAHLEPALSSLGRVQNVGLIVLPDPLLTPARDQILRAVAAQRIPAVYGNDFFTDDGGLLSYSVDLVDLAKRAAVYIDRILKGEKPGNLPVQAPTKFDLVVNLKTARAIGLKIPQSILVQATKVLE